MKRVYFYITAAAICWLTACAKETVQPVQEDQPAVQQDDITYIFANGSELAATKASIDDEAAFTWNTNDQIAVYSGSKYYKSKSLAADYNNTPEATFEFSGNINAGRKDFAIFPSSLVFNGSTVYENSAAEHDAECLTLNLPGEYNLSQVAFNKTPVPMISANAPDGGLAFKNLCALLRFKLVNVPKQTSYITFCFHGKKVYGCFSLTDVVPGESAIEAEDTEDEDVIRVNNNNYFSTFQKGLVINLPVPVGTYTDVTITTYDSDNHKINAFTTPINPSANWAAGRRSARKRIAYLPVFTLKGNINWGAGVKVVFAPGNLQATIERKPVYNQNIVGAVDSTSWRFAEHQYDALGNCAGNVLSSAGDIDLFAWIGESATYPYENNEKWGVIFPSYSSLNPKPSNWTEYLGNGAIGESLKYDWGMNLIHDEVGAYPAGTWRVPNRGEEINNSWTTEWQRVLTARKDPNNGNALIPYQCAKATLKNGEEVVAYGLIVFPDTYNHPADVPALTNYAAGKASSAHYSGNILTLEDWSKMEGAGCVFLPVTNVRTKPSAVECRNNGDAAYWASFATGSSNGSALVVSDAEVCEKSLNGDNATQMNGSKSCGRQNGCAVRLVRQVN